MATTKITNASDSAAAAGKFSQLDLVSREQEQHCESKLAQYFKTFADSRQTSTPGPITTPSPRSGTTSGISRQRYESRENRRCHSAESDPKQ